MCATRRAVVVRAKGLARLLIRDKTSYCRKTTAMCATRRAVVVRANGLARLLIRDKTSYCRKTTAMCATRGKKRDRRVGASLGDVARRARGRRPRATRAKGASTERRREDAVATPSRRRRDSNRI
jgi:hypothetical protein